MMLEQEQQQELLTRLVKNKILVLLNFVLLFIIEIDYNSYTGSLFSISLYSFIDFNKNILFTNTMFFYIFLNSIFLLFLFIYILFIIKRKIKKVLIILVFYWILLFLFILYIEHINIKKFIISSMPFLVYYILIIRNILNWKYFKFNDE